MAISSMTTLRSVLFSAAMLSTAVFATACDTSASEHEDVGDTSEPDGTGEDKDTGTMDATRFLVTVTNSAPSYPYLSSGAAAVPVGADGPGPLFPGNRYEATFAAAPGDHLSLATMMVQSNDLFYSVGQWGVPLFIDGVARETIDLTSDINVYDAGTEENEELGVGANQAPRQASADAGAVDSNTKVRLATTSEFPNLPDVPEVISASVESLGEGLFRLTVHNVSNTNTLSHSGGSSAVPLGPVAWTVHREGVNPLFSQGESDRGEGLEALAETGSPAELHTTLSAQTGVTSPISPGVYAVHTGSGVLYNEGNADRGQGLELLAEAGMPGELAETLMVRGDVVDAGVFNTIMGASSPSPAASGQSYQFEISAMPGDKLSLATMYIQSNDLFVAFGDAGLDLFNGTEPVNGDVSAQLQLLDAGTEVNEVPGAGPNQGPRQASEDQGTSELGLVEMVNDEFDYPNAWDLVQVTVTTI